MTTTDDVRRLRVALVHDYLTQRGGAERVLLSLHRLFPEAPVHTAIYDADGTFPEYRDVDVHQTPLGLLPGAGRLVRALLPLYPAAFRTIVLRGYDLVLSQSTGWAHAVRPRGAHHVVYCHTPPRWLWRTETYLDEKGGAPKALQPVLNGLLAALRRWDRHAAARPHLYIANSQNVAARIKAVYGRDAPIVHPPVDVDRLARLVGPTPPPPGDHWLVVARLLPYKRVDLAVEAARLRGERLVVVGDGPATEGLDAPHVDWRRGTPDAELAGLLASCRGLLVPGEEDFGLMPLEANAAGRPVVAYAAGGALETVVDGTTGILFRPQTAEALADAMGRAAATAFDRDALLAHARRFDEPAFHARMLETIAASMP